MNKGLLKIEEVMAWAKDAKAMTQLNGYFYGVNLNNHRHFCTLAMIAREQGLIETTGNKNMWVRGDITEPVAFVLLKGLRQYTDGKTAERNKRAKANGDKEPQLPLVETDNGMSRLDRIEERLNAMEGAIEVVPLDMARVEELESTVKLLESSVKELLRELH